MHKRANYTLGTNLPFRVLHPQQAERYYTHVLYEIEGPLAPFARLSWTLRWDLPPGESFAAQVVPSAYTNFTCMPEGARITGVTTGLYGYEVKGSGVIIGIMFRPGGIAAFFDSPRDLVDGFLPAQRIFPSVDDAFNRQVIDSTDQTALDMMHQVLRSHAPAPDPNIALIGEIIDRVRSSRGVSVRSLAEEFAMSMRTLQRLFEQYVGVGLKWVMLRDRLQQATLLADTVVDPNWTEIAYDLGYTDQSHFINDFKRIVGMTPRQYALGRHAHQGATRQAD